MHELKVAESIIKTVRSEMISNGYAVVSEIGLEIGEMTDIVEDSLRFGIEAITKGTDLENINLIIKIIPLLAECNACHQQFKIIDYKFICPVCGGVKINIIKGRELDISYLEFETTTKPKI